MCACVCVSAGMCMCVCVCVCARGEGVHVRERVCERVRAFLCPCMCVNFRLSRLLTCRFLSFTNAHTTSRPLSLVVLLSSPVRICILFVRAFTCGCVSACICVLCMNITKGSCGCGRHLVCLYVCVCVPMCLCVRTCVYVCVHVHVYIFE